MTQHRILRYEVPVDDRWHTLGVETDHGFAKVLHVAARRPDVVEFWIRSDSSGHTYPLTLRVFGTGQPFPGTGHAWEEPDRAVHLGTALTADGALVWHLIQAPPWPLVD